MPQASLPSYPELCIDSPVSLSSGITSGSTSSSRNAGTIRSARRNAVDFHATGLPKDHWHRGMPTQRVSPRPFHCFGIFFRPVTSNGHQPLVGVALSECEYGGKYALELRHSEVLPLLPHELGAWGMVLITWPGYTHLQHHERVNLDAPLGNVASQIAYMFRRFYDKCHREFREPGIRLGPGYITFNHLRLCSIWHDGRDWNIEIAYVYEGQPGGNGN